MGRVSTEEAIETLNKSLISSTDLGSNGKLNPKQADKFLDYVFDLTGLKKLVRTEKFRNESMELPKLSIGGRVSFAAEEGRDPGVSVGVSTSKVTLTPKEVITPFEFSDIFDEINVEGMTVEDHIVRMMATQMGNDLETLCIHGDSLGQAAVQGDIIPGGDPSRYIKDTYLALYDGWLRQADSGNIVDVAGDAISTSVFTRAINAMPVKFRQQRGRLRFFCSPDLELMWRERLSNRGTAGGDMALNSLGNVVAYGIPLVALPLWEPNPTIVEHVVVTGTTPTALRYSNIVSGSVVVTASTLSSTPTVPFVDTTDYSVDLSAGTIVRVGSGIGSGATIKVTYQVGPQMILTHEKNFICAIGRDVRIEKDRNIRKRVNEYVVTTKVDAKFEEVSAVVKVNNIANSL